MMRATLKRRGITKLFKWVKSAELTVRKGESDLEFANGSWAVQRDKAFVDRLLKTILIAVKEYERWIVEAYAEGKGGLNPEGIAGYSFLGRYLDDGGSPLYAWWIRQASICHKCFREYGQPFYAINCKCPHPSVKETRSLP